METEKEIEKIIAYQARAFVGKFPVSAAQEVEDLAQEGYIIFLTAQERYDAKRGASFETFFTHCLRNHYKNMLYTAYAQKNVAWLEPLEGEASQSVGPCYELARVDLDIDLVKLRAELSPFAREIFDCYTNPTKDFVELVLVESDFRMRMSNKGLCADFSPRATQYLVADFLGVSTAVVSQTFREIRDAVSSYLS